MTKVSQNFLYKFQRLGEQTEIPGIFMVWSGLAAVSAALGRSIWLDMGVYKVFPNLFTIFVAKSGRCRKSTALSLTERALESVRDEVNLISQKVTFQSLLDDLRQVDSQQVKETHQGFVIVDEVTTFLNRGAWETGIAELLNQLLDCKESFKYRTKGRGVEEIKKACLGGLGATTVKWIREAIPEQFVGTGLMSRLLFVHTDDVPPPVAVTTFGPEKFQALKEVQQELVTISKLKGQVRFSADGEKTYVDLYERFYRESPFYDDPVLEGYASRRHVFLLKLAIIFCVVEEAFPVLQPSHLLAAEALLTDTERGLPLVMDLIHETQEGSDAQWVLSKIAKRRCISRTDLLRSVCRKLSASDLDRVIETLKQSGQVTASVKTGQMFYQIT